MFNQNLAYSVYIADVNIPLWDYLISEITKVFRLSREESQKLQNSVTAKIIATIPFAAKCNNPERIAISHMGMYLMEIKGFQDFCNHTTPDDNNIFNRLERISHFDGGDKNIIEHGMAILALIMLEGYKKSSSEDLKNNVYNPIANKKWNYRQMKNKLLNIISKIECPPIDNLFYPAVMIGW